MSLSSVLMRVWKLRTPGPNHPCKHSQYYTKSTSSVIYGNIM